MDQTSTAITQKLQITATFRKTISLSLLALVGCNSVLDESQMSGVLTVNRAQWGNEFLEVKDNESKMTRFIHPGRKIIEILPGVSHSKVIMRDSRRVQLAVVQVPNEGFNINQGTFYFSGPQIEQVFDLKGERKRVLLSESVRPKSGGRKCSTGWTGNLWKIEEYRFDYVVHFVNRANGQDIGTFLATGDERIDAKAIRTSSCLPETARVRNREEAIQ